MNISVKVYERILPDESVHDVAVKASLSGGYIVCIGSITYLVTTSKGIV